LVPELTRIVDIQLNKRLWLRRHPDTLSLPHRTISPKRPGPPLAKPSGDHIPLGGFVLKPRWNGSFSRLHRDRIISVRDMPDGRDRRKYSGCTKCADQR
jgi:hypothetical protein